MKVTQVENQAMVAGFVMFCIMAIAGYVMMGPNYVDSNLVFVDALFSTLSATCTLGAIMVSRVVAKHYAKVPEGESNPENYYVLFRASLLVLVLLLALVGAAETLVLLYGGATVSLPNADLFAMYFLGIGLFYCVLWFLYARANRKVNGQSSLLTAETLNAKVNAFLLIGVMFIYIAVINIQAISSISIGQSSIGAMADNLILLVIIAVISPEPIKLAKSALKQLRTNKTMVSITGHKA
ncbi:hypothetical protein BCU70_12540 [Vibrio sp. 10N.286.49.C2]|uniref:cation transporter n=1 Tax=unclassified Vibrio TaxID=2614977 RepID=UPI000C8441A2|nr:MULTISPECIES: cation transporter [unclassified Vibrio]PMH39643.1 hypothetical protein BCU70_12540 [Vibrio sp. 10N.286.49.C2]PMH57738.1 hypothetical protein BCU66_00335 [Vibrio sp. 10N.286.49.B1]PMH82714.1 hypothetical protein BCU58_17065 [Vibrio sp. 10N.286.48.B7]